jgi:hypothetical protein
LLDLSAESLKSSQTRGIQIASTLALARAGDTEQAQKLAQALDVDYPLDTTMQSFYLPTIRAAMKLHANDPASAIEILRPTLKDELAANSLGDLYPAYVRGQVSSNA